jgi:hypothetical protein
MKTKLKLHNGIREEKQYPKAILNCIDDLFPKGDKRRGDALLLQAVAFIEGLKEGSKKK